MFDDTALPSLTVAISVQEWDNLLAAYDKDSNTREYFRCNTVTLNKDGASVSSRDAGLRLRGNTSRRRPEGSRGQKHDASHPDWHHAHFGIHMRKFNEDGSISGIRRINLKYAKEDPTYVREHFCFDMLQRYGIWTAPRTSWCKLYIKVGDSAPAYFGVYLMMESIDHQYVKRRPEFGNPDGFLWKCTWGANLRDRDDWRFHLDDNSSKKYTYCLKSDSAFDFTFAREQLKNFINKLNNLRGDEFKIWIESHCDVDLLLKMYASFVALGHWDDYWNNMNNYYLYFDSQNNSDYKVYMLPYDLDNTLGTTKNCGVQSDAGRQDPYRWGIGECPLISKILEVEEFRTIYTGYLRELSDPTNPYTGVEPAMERIRLWQEALSPCTANDTGEDMEIKDRPASWGNHSEYRIATDGASNWFRVKCESLSKWIN